MIAKIFTPPIVRLLALGLALSGCATQTPNQAERPPDTVIANAAAAADTAFARGSFEIAATHYGRALQQARALDNAETIGTYAFNLAICKIATGDFAAARDLLREAETELDRADLPLADVFLTQAYLDYHQGLETTSLTAVKIAAQRVIDDPRSQPTPLHRTQVSLLLAVVACSQKDAAATRAHLADAGKQAGPQSSLTLQAGLARVNGCLSLLRGDSVRAGKQFDEEAGLMRANRRKRDMASALRRAGKAYRQAGRADLAVERYYRAARSWFGQGNIAEAQKDLAAAKAIAKRIQDTNLQPLIHGLEKEIDESTDN